MIFTIFAISYYFLSLFLIIIFIDLFIIVVQLLKVTGLLKHWLKLIKANKVFSFRREKILILKIMFTLLHQITLLINRPSIHFHGLNHIGSQTWVSFYISNFYSFSFLKVQLLLFLFLLFSYSQEIFFLNSFNIVSIFIIIKIVYIYIYLLCNRWLNDLIISQLTQTWCF